MKSLYKNPVAIVSVVLATASFIYFENRLPAINLSNLDTASIIAALGYLSVVILIVEQFIEIFVYDPNEKVKMQCKERIADINKYLESRNNPIDTDIEEDEDEETVDTESTEKTAKVMKEKRELEEYLMTRGLKRQRKTTIIAFIIGLVLSLSGLRLMSGIIFNGPEEELSSIQVTIVQSLDIILTAGIIAGGSGRVHRLIKRIKEAMGSSESF